MNPPANDDALALLREIRDLQRVQIEHQAAALALQREQFEMVKRQFDRAERINERAEAIQARSAGMLDFARRALWLIVPVMALLLTLILWPYVVTLWR
jgi:hypothetical protein